MQPPLLSLESRGSGSIDPSEGHVRRFCPRVLQALVGVVLLRLLVVFRVATGGRRLVDLGGTMRLPLQGGVDASVREGGHDRLLLRCPGSDIRRRSREGVRRHRTDPMVAEWSGGVGEQGGTPPTVVAALGHPHDDGGGLRDWTSFFQECDQPPAMILLLRSEN